MRTLFLFLLLFAGFAQAATYRIDARSVSYAKQTQLTVNWRWKFFYFNAAGVYQGQISLTNPAGTQANLYDLAGTTTAFTSGSDFYGVICAAHSSVYATGTATGSDGQQYPRFYPLQWVSAYEVGGDEPQENTTGPFSPTFEPVGDPMTGVSEPPPVAHEKSVTLINDGATQKGYRVVAIGENDEILSDSKHVLEPDQKKTLTFKYEEAFSVEIYEMQRLIDPADPEGTPQWLSDTEPIETLAADESETPAPTGGQATDGGTQSAGGGAPMAASASSQSRVAPLDEAAKETNADARNQELRDEVARVAEQVKLSGDATTDAIKGLSSKVGDLLGDGKAGPALDQGPAVGVADEGALSFLTGIPTRLNNLKTSLGNLVGALGLATPVASTAPSWTFESFGASTTVSLAGADFSFVRSITLWLISFAAVWRAIGIIRGMFADESA